MHEYRAIEAYDVIAYLDDVFPPCLFDVVLEFDAEWAVVVAACEAAVYFAGLEYEASSLAERYDVVEFCKLSHTCVSFG